MQPKKKHPYYNFNRILGYTAAFWFFIVGGRGLGKTYGAKKKAIKDFIRKGEQFIYLRRFKPELAAARATFFADIAHEFPDWDFRIHGNIAQGAPKKTQGEEKRTWADMGFFIALSTAQSQKSVAFPRVTKIIFDEFILEKTNTQYLPNEATVFLNFYSTVDRYQDKTKVFFLANSVSIMNPYFLEYDIRPDDSKDQFIVAFDGYIVCHFPDAENFSASVFETQFGRFIQKTDYAKYAVANEFSDNTDAMLGAKDPRARYTYSLETKNGWFSVWHNIFTGEYTIQEKRPKVELKFTLVPERMEAHKVLMTYSDKPLQSLRTAFRTARIIFDKPSTRNTFTEIFKR